MPKFFLQESRWKYKKARQMLEYIEFTTNKYISYSSLLRRSGDISRFCGDRETLYNIFAFNQLM